MIMMIYDYSIIIYTRTYARDSIIIYLNIFLNYLLFFIIIIITMWCGTIWEWYVYYVEGVGVYLYIYRVDHNPLSTQSQF